MVHKADRPEERQCRGLARLGDAQRISRRGPGHVLLADDFFRLAHHDVTGKPLLHPSAISIGLGSSLLGELLAERRITIEQGRVDIVDRTPPGDSLAHAILDQLIVEPQQHTLQTWLAFLSHTSTEQVAQRLLRAGHVRAQVTRRLMQRATIYVPTDINTAALPGALLSTKLRRHEPLDYEYLCLAGFCAATGLDSYVLEGAPTATFDYLRHAVASLWAPMRELLHHTQAAIGNSVLAHRS